MTKRTKKQKFIQQSHDHVVPIRPKTPRQQEYIKAIFGYDQIVGIGPAGTGKTFLPAALAADAYRMLDINKIVLSRPNVPGGKSLGYFPGTLHEKIAPWVVPFTAVLEERLGPAVVQIALKKGGIEIVPFEVMRGRTFDNAWIILDEAQNTSPEEMKMFLTRVGECSKTIITGDLTQSDIRGMSGLQVVVDLANRYHMPVPVVRFGFEDIVRSDSCAMWIKAFGGAL